MTDTRRAYSAGRIFASSGAWSRAGITARYGFVVILVLVDILVAGPSRTLAS
jgi:hypothetical protein